MSHRVSAGHTHNDQRAAELQNNLACQQGRKASRRAPQCRRAVRGSGRLKQRQPGTRL